MELNIGLISKLNTQLKVQITNLEEVEITSLKNKTTSLEDELKKIRELNEDLKMKSVILRDEIELMQIQANTDKTQIKKLTSQLHMLGSKVSKNEAETQTELVKEESKEEPLQSAAAFKAMMVDVHT